MSDPRGLSTIGLYEVVNYIDEGSFAWVFEVRRTDHRVLERRRLALKMLKPDAARGDDAVRAGALTDEAGQLSDDAKLADDVAGHADDAEGALGDAADLALELAPEDDEAGEDAPSEIDSTLVGTAVLVVVGLFVVRRWRRG